MYLTAGEAQNLSFVRFCQYDQASSENCWNRLVNQRIACEPLLQAFIQRAMTPCPSLADRRDLTLKANRVTC